MNVSVANLLDQLRVTPWFANCGKPMSGEFAVAKSLGEARKSYSGQNGMRWENFKLAIMNRQGDLVWEATRNLREEIQREARATDSAVAKFVSENAQRIFASIEEDPALRRMIRLDLGWIAGEVEDPRLVDLNFFSRIILPIYLAGHMPCGWVGNRIERIWKGNSLTDLPEGRVIVY